MTHHVIPDDLKYTNSHEWIKDDSGEYIVGITEHAQSLLGDLVFVELPEIGRAVTKGQEAAVVESVKAASDVYAPISGNVSAVNTNLAQQPELINKDPYQAGWLFKIKPADTHEIAALLDAQDYHRLITD